MLNSYIFLNNPYKPRSKKSVKNENNNIIDLEIGKNVWSYIKKTFPDATKNKEQKLHYRSKLLWVYNEGKFRCDVEFCIAEVVDATYLDIVVEGKSKSQIVHCLEYIQTVLQDSGVQTDYIMVISYDAISEYYCNKMYPKLNNLERNLRRLLFNIYIVNFGSNYYRTTISEELQAKIKSVIRPRGSQKQKETTVVQEFFYSFEFNDIQNLLFVPKWTVVDEHAKNSFLTDNSNLSALSDEVLRNAFKSFKPQSDWDRFFSDKITDIDFQGVLESIRMHRNAVAHCKFFYRNSYKDCNSVISKLNKAILLAIKLTEEEDFAKKNDAALRKSMASIKEAFAQYNEKLSEIIKQITQVMYPPIPQTLWELPKSIASAYTLSLVEMKSTIPKIAESLSVGGVLKDIIKPLNIAEILSEETQRLQVENIYAPPIDDESSLLDNSESAEEDTSEQVDNGDK